MDKICINGKVCFENQLGQEFDRVFSEQFSIKIVKYEDEMLILGQNDIFCGYNVVNFSVWFLQLTVGISIHSVDYAPMHLWVKLFSKKDERNTSEYSPCWDISNWLDYQIIKVFDA